MARQGFDVSKPLTATNKFGIATARFYVDRPPRDPSSFQFGPASPRLNNKRGGSGWRSLLELSLARFQMYKGVRENQANLGSGPPRLSMNHKGGVLVTELIET